MFVKAMHWFNPVVHIMTAAICNDCEISCDEDVIGGTSSENRRTYCETIIGFIGTDKAVKSALSTNLYGGKNTMKKRIISIMNTGKKKTRIAFLCLALVFTATFLSGFVFSVGDSSADTADKVLDTVLAETGGGTVLKRELHYLGNADAGIRIYEIEVINGDVKYEIEIGADDLIIYDYEEKKPEKNPDAFLPADTDITPEKATEIALAKTGGGTVEECELDYGKGAWIYEIEVLLNKTEYEIEINAETSEVNKFKTDD